MDKIEEKIDRHLSESKLLEIYSDKKQKHKEKDLLFLMVYVFMNVYLEWCLDHKDESISSSEEEHINKLNLRWNELILEDYPDRENMIGKVISSILLVPRKHILEDNGFDYSVAQCFEFVYTGKYDLEYSKY